VYSPKSKEKRGEVCVTDSMSDEKNKKRNSLPQQRERNEMGMGGNRNPTESTGKTEIRSWRTQDWGVRSQGSALH
jgi:hypothetical protein